MDTQNASCLDSMAHIILSFEDSEMNKLFLKSVGVIIYDVSTNKGFEILALYVKITLQIEDKKAAKKIFQQIVQLKIGVNLIILDHWVKYISYANSILQNESLLENINFTHNEVQINFNDFARQINKIILKLLSRRVGNFNDLKTLFYDESMSLEIAENILLEAV